MQSRSPPDRANNLEIHLPFRGFQDFVLIIKHSLFYRADYVVTVIAVDSNEASRILEEPRSASVRDDLPLKNISTRAYAEKNHGTGRFPDFSERCSQ